MSNPASLRNESLIDCIEACAKLWLDADATVDAVQAAADRLHQVLIEQSGVLAAEPLTSAQGKAISPLDAAACLRDFRRTRCFVRAIDTALLALTTRWPGQRLRVLYAGCGPWAPLLLILARRWSGRLAIQLVDLHAASLDQAHTLFAEIGQSAAISKLSCVDAAQLCLAEAERPHLLVIEIMQRSFEHEPQVAVTAQLAPQLLPGGVLVPQRIRVDAVLARVEDEFKPQQARKRIALVDLLEVSIATAGMLRDDIARHMVGLPEVRTQVPADVADGLALMLRTRIEVAPDLWLDEYDSGLTAPLFVHALGTATVGRELKFQYRLGPQPGFSCAWIDP